MRRPGGGKSMFRRLREREGYDELKPARVSRLLAQHERREEVDTWRASELTDKQREDWASPEAIYQHCPLFAPAVSDPAAPDAEPAAAEMDDKPAKGAAGFSEEKILDFANAPLEKRQEMMARLAAIWDLEFAPLSAEAVFDWIDDAISEDKEEQTARDFVARIGWERAQHWLWELESKIEKAEEAAEDEAEEAAPAKKAKGK